MFLDPQLLLLAFVSILGFSLALGFLKLLFLLEVLHFKVLQLLAGILSEQLVLTHP